MCLPNLPLLRGVMCIIRQRMHWYVHNEEWYDATVACAYLIRLLRVCGETAPFLYSRTRLFFTHLFLPWLLLCCAFCAAPRDRWLVEAVDSSTFRPPLPRVKNDFLETRVALGVTRGTFRTEEDVFRIDSHSLSSRTMHYALAYACTL